MKKIVKKILLVLSITTLIALFAITGFAHSGRTDSSGGHRDNNNVSGLGSYHYHCGGYAAHLHESGYCPYTDVFPSYVEIEAETSTTLGLGESVELVATVYPSNACSTRVSWSSSDTSVATVSNGRVMAKAFGTAIIYAETFNEVCGTVTITVKEITAEEVKVSGLPKKDHYYIGDKFSLTSTIKPENVDNPTITWSSSDKKIATVSKEGEVKLLEKGEVEIRATASNGVVGKVVINVEEKYVKTVDIEKEKLEILLLEEIALKATVSPKDATHPELTWKSKNPSIVSVSKDGKITAKGCGETTITATSTNGVSDKIVVKVTEVKAESIKIEGPTSLLVEDKADFTWTILPEDTTVKIVEWSVSDESIATISKDGVLTAKNVGKVIVTAKQKDVSDEINVEILPIDVENIIITVDTDEGISKGDVVTFSAEVIPANATYKDITWSVSNPKVATIDEDGVLTALNGGIVKVVATSGDGFTVEYSAFIYAPIFAIILVLLCSATIAIVVIILKKKKK